MVSSTSMVAALAFFFFADLDSDLTCGFWVAAAAILWSGMGIRRVLESIEACVRGCDEAVRSSIRQGSLEGSLRSNELLFCRKCAELLYSMENVYRGSEAVVKYFGSTCNSPGGLSEGGRTIRKQKEELQTLHEHGSKRINIL